MDFQGTLFETPAPGLRSLAGTERHPLSLVQEDGGRTLGVV